MFSEGLFYCIFFIYFFHLYKAALDKTVMSCSKCNSCTNYSLSTSKSVCLGIDGSNLPLNYGTFHVFNMNEIAKCL